MHHHSSWSGIGSIILGLLLIYLAGSEVIVRILILLFGLLLVYRGLAARFGRSPFVFSQFFSYANRFSNRF